MKVIGAGLGRTGTASLVIALRELGFTSYHMKEGVFHTPGQLERWVAYINTLEAGDEAAKDIALEQLVDSIVEAGFDATTDYPACLIYKELMDRFPDAKVVLTKRDSGMKWAESVNATIGRGYRLSVNKSDDRPKLEAAQAILTKYLWEKTPFVEVNPDQTLNEEALARAHDNWVEEVVASVPKERLLVFESQMGWKPLCDFLDVPIPDIPYPRTNTKEELSRFFDMLEEKAKKNSHNSRL